MSEPQFSPLTYPRLQKLLSSEFIRSRRYGYPLSCLAARVDGLEAIGVRCGPSAKGEILHSVADLLQATSRVSDRVACYGDRITLVVPHTDHSGAAAMGARLICEVAKLEGRVQAAEVEASISVGAATRSGQAEAVAGAVLQEAEEALSEAQLEGGRLVSAPLGPPEDDAVSD